MFFGGLLVFNLTTFSKELWQHGLLSYWYIEYPDWMFLEFHCNIHQTLDSGHSTQQWRAASHLQKHWGLGHYSWTCFLLIYPGISPLWACHHFRWRSWFPLEEDRNPGWSVWHLCPHLAVWSRTCRWHHHLHSQMAMWSGYTDSFQWCRYPIDSSLHWAVVPLYFPANSHHESQTKGTAVINIE